MKPRFEGHISRRSLLRQSGCGLGLLGLASLLADDSLVKADSKPLSPLAPKEPHFAPKAKRVIFLFMHGGPSHIDTFDPKPRLILDHGKPLPLKRSLTFDATQVGGLMKSPWEFKRCGQRLPDSMAKSPASPTSWST